MRLPASRTELVLEEIRRADPEGRWPRIVAVIDEFQFLFAERDAVTREAVTLLEELEGAARVPVLIAALNDPDDVVRDSALNALRAVRDTGVGDELTRALACANACS